jgi:hypothetical protein
MGWMDRHQGAGPRGFGLDGGRAGGTDEGLTGPASSKHTCRECLHRLHGLGLAAWPCGHIPFRCPSKEKQLPGNYSILLNE